VSDIKEKEIYQRVKLETIRLRDESGKPAVQVARELGIRRNQLRTVGKVNGCVVMGESNLGSRVICTWIYASF
jgi:hypothetical protein